MVTAWDRAEMIVILGKESFYLTYDLPKRGQSIKLVHVPGYRASLPIEECASIWRLEMPKRIRYAE